MSSSPRSYRTIGRGLMDIIGVGIYSVTGLRKRHGNGYCDDRPDFCQD